ncbi:chromate resistance protein ChrB [Mycolicibacterium agri]|uniref:Chromate resistance protein ChrB n=1 Tax=Mycolicibacterium agri TaxID=36811 RepID=A0A2A7N336_MYCAG|nr:Chromate resistance protein ChrB [Mycolicibacterium agri]PEG38250.1 chromate resistance protein ChrB [Mycolicibacterium agri]
MTDDTTPRWWVLATRLPAGPSRHRVAVWRELRRTGAIQLGQGTWAVPDLPVFDDGVQRVLELVRRGDGEVVTLAAAGRDESDNARLETMFTSARQEEWSEFLAECHKFDAEIDKEIGKGKLTVAELEEEEQSLDRLRRWYREIKLRDVFSAPEARQAEQQLKRCAERLEDYTERVFQAAHGTNDEGLV